MFRTPGTRLLKWQGAAIWYVAAIVIGSLGSQWAYHGWLSSDAWLRWGRWSTKGIDPVQLDFTRICMAAALAYFGLIALEMFSGDEKNARRLVVGRAYLSRAELLTTVIVFALLLLAAFYLLPANFQNVYAQLLKDKTIESPVPEPLSWSEIWGPYYKCYFLYVYALWMCIVFPVLLALGRSIRADAAILNSARSILQSPLQRITNLAVQDFVDACNSYFSKLQDTAIHYLPVVLAVITAALIEGMTELRCSVLFGAAILGVYALWILWIPALLCVALLYGIQYGAIAKLVKQRLTELRRDARASIDAIEAALSDAGAPAKDTPERKRLEDTESDQKSAVSTVDSFRKDVDKDRTPVNAYLALIKNGNISVFLLVSVVTTAFGLIFKNQAYIIYSVVPPPVVDAISRFLFSHPAAVPPACG